MIYANQAILDIFNIDSYEKFNVKSPLEYLTPECKKKTRERIEKRANGIEQADIFLIDIIRDDNEERTLEIYFADIIINEETCRLLTFNDVTKQKLAENKLKNSLLEKQVLLEEIHHRVKNNMNVISSLLSLQADNIEDNHIKGIFKASQNRVYAMAAVHETLHGSENLSDIDLEKYLSKITKSIFQSSSIDPKSIKLISDIENMSININQASPLGLIINEILYNSLKYAFPNGNKGEIKVSMKKLNNEYKLIIMDNGIGIPDKFDWENSSTLGLKLVHTLVESQTQRYNRT